MINRRRNRGASRPRAGAADEANGFSADTAPEKPDEPHPLAKPIWLHPRWQREPSSTRTSGAKNGP